MGSECHGVINVVMLNVVADVGLATKDVESCIDGLDLEVANTLSVKFILIFSLEIYTRQLKPVSFNHVENVSRVCQALKDSGSIC